MTIQHNLQIMVAELIRLAKWRDRYKKKIKK